MVVHKAYRSRLCPNREQAALLARFAGARRFAYNWALERWLEHYRETDSTISVTQLMRELTALKREPTHQWLREIDSQLLQQAVFDLRASFRAFFERHAGFPRFRSRKSARQTFRIPQRIRIEGNRVLVPELGRIRLRLSRPVEGRCKGATFKRDAAGDWWVSIVAELDVPDPPEDPPHRPVGIDLGLVDFVVLSDGSRLVRPAFALDDERRLRRARRDLARKQRGSRNRERSRRRVARLERAIASRRRDFLHKLTTRLVRTYDLICVEDLGVTGLARTKLSKSVHDASFAEFRRQLEYKAVASGRRCVAVDRFFPSSRTCSYCGAINADLLPRQRRWTCACGADHDRDVNAARNILEEGIRQLVAVGRTDT